MTFELTTHQTLAQIQLLFNTYFPYLKIDFFEINLSAPLLHRLTLDKTRRLAEFCKNGEALIPFLIDKDVKVKSVEDHIRSSCSIYALVYRKSGTVWLETTVTNNWTLGEQNEQGRTISLQLLERRTE